MENQTTEKLNIVRKQEDIPLSNSQEAIKEVAQPEEMADKTVEKIENETSEILSEGLQKFEQGSKSLGATDREIAEAKKSLLPIQENIKKAEESSKEKITIAMKKYADKIMMAVGFKSNLDQRDSLKENIEEKTFLERNLGNIEEIFKLSPELSAVATPERYAEYLANMFPDSVAKNVVWHGSRHSFEKFKNTTINFFGMKLNRGTYFSTSPDYAKHFSQQTGQDGKVYPAMINITKPFSPLFDHILFSEKKGDGFVNLNKRDVANMRIDEYAIFDASQINILGDQKDITTFKSWSEQDTSVIK